MGAVRYCDRSARRIRWCRRGAILPGDDRIAGKVPIARRDSMTMIKRDGPPIAAHEVGKDSRRRLLEL